MLLTERLSRSFYACPVDMLTTPTLTRQTTYEPEDIRLWPANRGVLNVRKQEKLLREEKEARPFRAESSHERMTVVASGQPRSRLPAKAILLFACLQWPQPETQAIQSIGANPIDWQQFLELVKRHH